MCSNCVQAKALKKNTFYMKCMRFGLVCRMVSSKTPTMENSRKITHNMEGDQRNTKRVINKQKHGRILPG